MAEVNKTTVHDLAEERSVGSVNNEVKIRSKGNLESVSKKMVLNKYFDLLEEQESKMYRKPAQDVKKLRAEWKEKMQAMENDAFSNEEKINKHLDNVKYKDLEFLESHGGPFTTSEEVYNFF